MKLEHKAGLVTEAWRRVGEKDTKDRQFPGNFQMQSRVSKHGSKTRVRDWNSTVSLRPGFV